MLKPQRLPRRAADEGSEDLGAMSDLRAERPAEAVEAYDSDDEIGAVRYDRLPGGRGLDGKPARAVRLDEDEIGIHTKSLHARAMYPYELLPFRLRRGGEDEGAGSARRREIPDGPAFICGTGKTRIDDHAVDGPARLRARIAQPRRRRRDEPEIGQLADQDEHRARLAPRSREGDDEGPAAGG